MIKSQVLSTYVLSKAARWLRLQKTFGLIVLYFSSLETYWPTSLVLVLALVWPLAFGLPMCLTSDYYPKISIKWKDDLADTYVIFFWTHIIKSKDVRLFFNQTYFLTFLAWFSIPIIFSNLNSDCSKVLDLRNLQEQVKKAFCFKNWSDLDFTVQINFANSQAFSVEFQKFFFITRTIFIHNRLGKFWKQNTIFKFQKCLTSSS